MWLIGMMGSGKTTVGEQTAARLGVGFYDTDRIVVEMSQMPIDEIWERDGAARFREMERRAVASVPISGCVAAAGGGAVLNPENREHILRGRPVVWLRCDPLVLARRMSADGTRPLLAGGGSTEEKLSSILDQRSATYSELATDVVDTDDRSMDDVVSALVEIWRR